MGGRAHLTPEEYYGPDYGMLVAIRNRLVGNIEAFILTHEAPDGERPVVYHQARIKSPESLDAKLARRGFVGSGYKEAVAAGMHDIVGARVVCAFVDDVYSVASWLMSCPDYELVETKDYIAYPKPNGYRSLHLILRIASGVGAGMLVEVQLRTIAMDTWSTLEHKIKYKKDIPNEAMMRRELKRCADEMASVDLDMQALRDAIRTSSQFAEALEGAAQAAGDGERPQAGAAADI